jgi:tripartite-type tricarboxylate transporter receptor subunit TctC
MNGSFVLKTAGKVILHPSTFILCLAVALNAGAQTFPTKPLRVINPAAPGGNSDIFFRLLSPRMSEVLGHNLIFDYRPGAGSWRAAS